MATKSELEAQVTALQSRFSVLEEGLMQTSRGLRGELNSVVELLAKVRNDLDRVRADVERTKNTVETMRALTANYDVKTKSF
mgnify:CR=1 FL=1